MFLFKNGKKLIGFDIVLTNKPGALRYMSSITEKYGLNIVYIEECGISEESGRFFIAVDFTDKNVDPETLLAEFRNAKKYITSADISSSLNDIIFPKKFCSKDIGSVRAILMAVGGMRGVVMGIREHLGVEGGNALLYHLGYGDGEESYKVYAKPRGIKNLDEAILLLEALTKGTGWADFIGYEVADNKIIIRLERLWEYEIQKGIVDKPASNFVRGILAGVFKKLLGKEVVVKGTRCIAVGDPCCQFEINIIG